MLFDPAFYENPYPSYTELRTSGRIHYINLLGGSWVFPCYTDVTSLLMDPRLSASRSNVLIDQFPEEKRKEFEEFKRLFSMWMLFFDPPEHARTRRVMVAAFARVALLGIRPKIQKIVDELLDKVEHNGQMDAIADFAYPLPAVVIAEFLGVPTDDRDRFVTWCDEIAEFFGSSAATSDMARKAQRSLIELTSYFKAIVPERRKQRGDDLMSYLINLKQLDESLTEEELYAQCVMLLFAGHETTRNFIGNGLLALLQHPDQMCLLRKNPSLVKVAVDEFLRYDSPVQFGTRLARDDIELYGKKVKKGELVILLLGSANRDPEAFTNPDQLDITRQVNKHVSFGYGSHLCIGANLAHLEGEIAFKTLLRRIPEIRLESQELTWSNNFGFRGLKSLPVLF